MRLLNAYRNGIFPWFSEGEPILWWSPDPRMVVAPADLHLGRRLRRSLRQCGWTIEADRDFAAVIGRCAELPRRGQHGTWITREMRAAYLELHRLGHAHSVEVRDTDDRLVGGIYGIAIGRVFFGESMFSLASGGSQAAIGGLCRRLEEWGFELLDGQVESDHLATLGFAPIARAEFLSRCVGACSRPSRTGSWRGEFGRLPATELR
jgi:leucyl/phenylalanyl-tRNA---protein transferase